MSYSQALAISSNIKDKAVTKGIMPPWPPDAKYKHFKDERVLSTVEKDLIARWVDGGAPEGNPILAPDPPIFSKGSKINAPDISLRMPVYTSKATSEDLYRCFILDPKLTANQKIEQIEVLPGNSDIVHHVLIYQDTTNKPTNLDNADPDTGYTSFGGVGSDKAILIGAWVPGSSPKILPTGMAMTLFQKSKIILQIHYPKGTSGAIDSTRINIKYSTSTNPREVFFQPILNEKLINNYPFLFIPKDSIRTFQQVYTIPFLDFSMLSMAPHMHLVGQSYKVFTVTPTGDTLRGIDIPNWDFHWQDEYTFKKVQKVPAGSKVYGIAKYNNTAANPLNPNTPTKAISWGEATNDEMMLTFVSFMIYQPGDENIVLDTSADIDLGPLVTKPNSIQLIDKNEDLSVYPNPADERLNIIYELGEAEKTQVQILSIEGKVIYSNQILSNNGMNKLSINTSEIAAGLYLLKLNTNRVSMMKQIVIE